MTLKVDGTNGVLQAYDYQVLTTGFSYTFASGTQTLVINPAGTLATGTITMPASPVDGMVITVSSTKQITALTLNGNTGQTVNTTTTFMPAGSSLSYVYRLSSTTWLPMNNVPQLVNVPVGVGQTWTDVTASRALSTTYTNTTGRPIEVIVSGYTTGGTSGCAIYLVVGSTTNYGCWAYSGAVPASSVSAIVPNGVTYQATITGSGYLAIWNELR